MQEYRFSVTNIPNFDLSTASNTRKKTRNAIILLARFEIQSDMYVYFYSETFA